MILRNISGNSSLLVLITVYLWINRSYASFESSTISRTLDSIIEEKHHIRSIIHDRLHRLRRISHLQQLRSRCNDSAIIVITEIPYGNSGNHIIEFTHGLWLSTVYNYTLNVPWWIRPSLSLFNLSSLHDRFCFNFDDQIPKSAKILEVTSEDSFFIYKLFKDPMYTSVIPPYNQSIIEEISRHFIMTYAALWSSPSHHILNASAWLIHHKLNSNFSYVSIHKRSLEGGCNKLLTMSSINEYDPLQIDLNDTAWTGNLRSFHPLCEMPLNFALNSMALNHRAGQPIFIAWDGRGNIDDYRRLNATLSSDLDSELFPTTTHNRKYVDMFIAMNGDFFLLNPYSTFSFQIYVIRVAMGLEGGVPTLSSRDLYFKTKQESPVEDLWVSFDSIVKAAKQIKSLVLR